MVKDKELKEWLSSWRTFLKHAPTLYDLDTIKRLIVMERHGAKRYSVLKQLIIRKYTVIKNQEIEKLNKYR